MTNYAGTVGVQALGKVAHMSAVSACSIDGCVLPVKARQRCQKHYSAWLRHEARPSDVRSFTKRTAGTTCDVNGCDRPHNARGYCRGHYDKGLRDGWDQVETLRPCKRGEDYGTGHLNSRGYVMVSSNGHPSYRTGQMPEHRKVMEDYIGRYLHSNEQVHHKNGVKHDNRLENLELWTTNQPYGQRVEDQIEWAKAILARYPEAERQKLKRLRRKPKFTRKEP